MGRVASKNNFVSFVVVGWNNIDILEECFSSIEAQTYKNCRAIYVDNGSVDGSLNYLKKHHPDVILIDAKENHGFAIGNNIGIKRALEDKDCAYIALLNSDARVENDWVKKLIAFATKHPRSAALQSPTFDYYDHNVLDSYGINVDCSGRAVQLGHRYNGPLPASQQVFGTNAAATIYTRGFLEAQPFGEDYFDSDLWMYLEDVDLAARATVMGWANWFVNESAAYHMGSASSSKNPGFSVYMIYRNNWPMLIKNIPPSTLIQIAFNSIFTDSILILGLLRHRNFRTVKVIIKARIKSLPMLPVFIRKRQTLKKYRSISNGALTKLMRSEI